MGREIVDAVGEGDDLLVELGFAGLLDAGVEITYVGGTGDDGFAVDFEHEAEDAVGADGCCGPMLRTMVLIARPGSSLPWWVRRRTRGRRRCSGVDHVRGLAMGMGGLLGGFRRWDQ